MQRRLALHGPGIVHEETAYRLPVVEARLIEQIERIREWPTLSETSVCGQRGRGLGQALARAGAKTDAFHRELAVKWQALDRRAHGIAHRDERLQ